MVIQNERLGGAWGMDDGRIQEKWELETCLKASLF